MLNLRSLKLILGFGCHCRNSAEKGCLLSRFHFTAVATCWVMSLVGIYPGKASFCSTARRFYSFCNGDKKSLFPCYFLPAGFRAKESLRAVQGHRNKFFAKVRGRSPLAWEYQSRTSSLRS